MSWIAVLSDTHWSRPESYLSRLDQQLLGCSLILHAGDCVERFVLDRLSRIAPLQAVAGNCDRGSVRDWCPAVREFDYQGVRFGMLHGHQVDLHSPETILEQFSPDVQFIVHGHTHIPANYRFQGKQIFNPGSISEPRGSSSPSWGALRIKDGAVEVRHMTI